MKTFGREELLAFLQEIDELLAEPVAIEIIGGAASQNRICTMSPRRLMKT